VTPVRFTFPVENSLHVVLDALFSRQAGPSERTTQLNGGGLR
jgi:predicted transposase YbfD/YdcC